MSETLPERIPQEGLTTLTRVHTEYRDRIPDLSWTEFLTVGFGVRASEIIRCRVQGREYFEDDYFEADLRRHLDTLMHRFGSPALAIPTPRPVQMKELPWWRRWALRLLLPKTD